MRMKLAMAVSNASLVWALLVVGCLMNSGRSFVVQRPARVTASTSATRSRRGVATLAKRGLSSRPVAGEEVCSWRHHGAEMKITAVAAGPAGGSEILKSICSQTKLIMDALSTLYGMAACASEFWPGAVIMIKHVAFLLSRVEIEPLFFSPARSSIRHLMMSVCRPTRSYSQLTGHRGSLFLRALIVAV